jgi:hypothetical protein
MRKARDAAYYAAHRGERMIKSITFDGGVARFIYDEEIADMLDDLGPSVTRRASNVEPLDHGKGWTADMSLVGGALFGPFATRSDALKFEVAWLKENRGL